MNDGNFIVVQHWMVSKLGLSGNELLVFALIYGFSQDNESSFFGSAQYIADSIGTSRRSVMDILSRLVEKSYLEKNNTTINGVKMCSYKSCSNFIGYEESSQGGMKILHRGGYEESSHNNIDTHNKEHKKEKGCLDLSFLDQEPEKYKQAFLEYVEHRKSLKKPMNQQQVETTHKRLLTVSINERIEAIESSISAGWQGLFLPKSKKQEQTKTTQPVNPRPTHCDHCGKPMVTNKCSCGRQLFSNNGVYSFEDGPSVDVKKQFNEAMRILL